MGAICYKSIVLSGVTSPASIFRLINLIRGTLVVDEADFDFSNEKADLSKIFNIGNNAENAMFKVVENRSTPGMYADVPRFYDVYSPKIFATRGYYQDRALESRFITEEMGIRKVGRGIPINLPPVYKEEALVLRNKLLLYRLRNYQKKTLVDEAPFEEFDSRIAQVIRPLVSVIEDPEVREDALSIAREMDQSAVAERAMDIEARVLEALVVLQKEGNSEQIALKDITNYVVEHYGIEHDRVITPRWIGRILRHALQLRPYKSHGTFVVATKSLENLDRVFARYGIQKPQKGSESTS